MAHQRRRRVRDRSEKKRPQAGLAQRRRRAADPSTRISAADRAMAASSHSELLSRARNSSRHCALSQTSSSCPSVMRRISFTGTTHSRETFSLCTSARKILRSAPRRRATRESKWSAAGESLWARGRSWALRSWEMTREFSRNRMKPAQSDSAELAKSMARRPPIRSECRSLNRRFVPFW